MFCTFPNSLQFPAVGFSGKQDFSLHYVPILTQTFGREKDSFRKTNAIGKLIKCNISKTVKPYQPFRPIL